MTPEQEIKLLKELLYCTKRSCNNCGKVNCENFQRQRIDCCSLWVSYKDYIKELEADNDARKFAMAMSEKVEKQLREKNAELKKEVLEVRQHLELTEREWGKDTVELFHFKTQLTKAKELLAKWVELYKPKLEGWSITPIQEQTEQFLKDVPET